MDSKNEDVAKRETTEDQEYYWDKHLQASTQSGIE